MTKTAQRKPVKITRDGCRDVVSIAADRYGWLAAAARHSFRTEDAAQAVIDAVERAEMDPRHAHLDELLK